MPSTIGGAAIRMNGGLRCLRQFMALRPKKPLHRGIPLLGSSESMPGPQQLRPPYRVTTCVRLTQERPYECMRPHVLFLARGTFVNNTIRSCRHETAKHMPP